MAQAVAFGSITLCDLNDVGEFSVQPMSNMPLTVVYDPDQNSYTPNWGSSTLNVTPAVYYAGSAVTLGSAGLSISWQKQIGISAATNISSAAGENIINNGVLAVSANQFSASVSMVTYIVTATYTEPTLGTTLTAQGQITFALVRNAPKLKNIEIIGESIFKYDTNGAVVGGVGGVATITLTANASNVAITGWKYQASDGTWTTYPNSGTGETLTVNSNHNVFTNDKCIIKCETSDATVYDIHTITNLRDGAAGSGTVSAVLTNDDQMIPFNSSGVGDYSAAVSRIIIYEGGVDVTSTWTISQAYTSSVTATASATTKANDTVSVTGLTGQTGNVTFTCTKSGYNTLTKVFSVVKVESGADGVTPTIYSLEASSLAMNRDISNVYTPATVTFYGYQQTGGNNKTTYSGRFKIFEDISLSEYTAASPKPSAKYTSTSNEASHTYTPTVGAESILCILYQAGATTTQLDAQQVVITNDGPTGATGAQGAAGVSVILGNYSDVLSCTHDNKLVAQQVITIPFSAYQGTTRIGCSASAPQLLGVNPVVTSATSSSDGSIVWTLPQNKSVSTASGVASITFTASVSGGGTVQVVENYSWSRNSAPTDGENAVLLQIFTPYGTNIVTDTVTSVTLQATLLDGSTDVTSNSGITWAWAKFQNGAYSTISGATSSSYVVQGSTVDSYASFRCSATYNSKTYVAYFSVFDKTDPIQISVLSSIGTQIVNGQGVGALYVKVARNGQEIDQMASERFLTADPATATNGDMYYKLDETNKTVTLRKYNGSTWSDYTETYTGNYTWSWRDKNGDPLPSVGGHTLPTDGKVVYIDGSMIDQKIIADVGVRI